MNIYLLAFLSFIISFSGALFVIKYGIKFGLADVPSERSSHKTIIPKGGGVGILISFVIVSIVLKVDFQFSIPVLLISLLSFYGDRLDISPLLRLLFHFSASFIIIYNFSLHENTFFNLLLIFFSTVYIVGTANFYNFMDGIDGIAAISGIIAFSFIAIYIHFFGVNIKLKYLSICIVFSCLGFIPLNFPKAKVFMGDVGSLLLGISYAGMVIILSKSSSDFLCLIGFLFPFYSDELITMFVRWKDRDSFSKPHRKHLYQMLANELGIKHYKITFLYGFMQITISSVLLFIRYEGIHTIFLFHVVSFIIFTIFYYYIKNKVQNRLPI
jgi:Fuc2NAc and GlcNAc transferase